MTANRDRLAARANVEAARAELVDYLSQLEDAANFPKRIVRASRRARIRLSRFAKRQPLAAAGVAAAAVALLAGAIAVSRRSGRN